MRFTDAERAEIDAEVRRILKGEAPTAAPPKDDPVQRWREEADVADRAREANRAELRRQEREHAREYSEGWASYIERRIDEAVAGQQRLMDEFASASAEFSNVITERLAVVERLLGQLDTRLHQLHAVDDLRSRGAGAVLDLPDFLRKGQRVN